MTKLDIAALVPQQGPMCLLADVAHYDALGITCRAISHRSLSNPLRIDGRLPALSGIEYAAQALAAHCALTGDIVTQSAAAGLLAGVRAVTLHTERLDDVAEVLTVQAKRLVSNPPRLLYDFCILAGERELVTGRVAVVLGQRDSS